MAEKRYLFDGQMVTPAELARRVTAYSKPWLAEALRAGCQSVADLTRFYQQRYAKQRAGNTRGMKRTRQARPWKRREEWRPGKD